MLPPPDSGLELASSPPNRHTNFSLSDSLRGKMSEYEDGEAPIFRSRDPAMENVQIHQANNGSIASREAEVKKELESLRKDIEKDISLLSRAQEQQLVMPISYPREEVVVSSPYNLSAKSMEKIDYNKLIEKLGFSKLERSVVDRVERITGCQPHIFLRRGIYYAHRDFDHILDAYERGEKFYLYVGGALPSKSLHIGHLISFMFAKYLQDAFKVPLVIQLVDGEKYLWKKALSLEECKALVRENAKDIIACGFDISKTFIFTTTGYMYGLYENVLHVGKGVACSEVDGIFGFTGRDNIGMKTSVAIQVAPSFPSSFPHLFSCEDEKGLRCLIPCAINQDPYFRIARDAACSVGHHEPALIESSFFPALQGVDKKLSSVSDPNSAIYLTDCEKVIEKKIMKYAFSGGCNSIADHRKYGANLDVDIPFRYLTFFLEDDDELEHIRTEYGAGHMLTGKVKKRLIEVLREFVDRHRTARGAVTDELVDEFMAVRPLPNMFN